MKLSESRVFILQLLLFFLFSNLVLNRLVCRFDISSSKRLTLTKTTAIKLSSLKKPMVIDAYFSSDMPFDYTVRLELIHEFLLEIGKYNTVNIKINFFDPISGSPARTNALEAGLVPNEIRKSSETAKSFQEAFMGLVIKYDSEVEVISDFFFIEEAESQFVRALRRIEQKRKPQLLAVSFDPGTFETPLPGNGSGSQTWGVFYHQVIMKEYGSPVALSLNDMVIPKQVKVLLVVGSPEWSDIGKSRLDEFLQQGGRLIFLGSPIQFTVLPTRNKHGLDLESPSLAVPSPGYSFWSPLLGHYGFQVQTDLLFNFEHPLPLSSVSEYQKKNYPLWHYYYKSAGNLHQNHSLTNNSSLLLIPWPSSMTVEKSNQPKMNFETILSTDNHIWKKENVFSLSQNQKFNDQEIIRNRVITASLGEGLINPLFPGLNPLKPTKIFVVSTAFIVSDILSLPEFRLVMRDANVPFLLNAIDFMLDDLDYISSRKKKLAVFPLKAFTSRERYVYSAFNTILIPFIIIIFALKKIRKRNLGKY